MCECCATSPLESRRNFLRKLVCAAAAPAVLGLPGLRAEATLPTRTGWARLVTPNETWSFHRDRDFELAAFAAHEAGLKDLAALPAILPESPERLGAFPFLFTNDCAWIRDPHSLKNLREYLYRGGFVYADACVNGQVTPSFKVFYLDHVDLFQHLVPGAVVRPLKSDHPIFSARFPVPEAKLLQDAIKPGDPQWGGMIQALHGVWDDDRMIGLISLEHLFCGWPGDPMWSYWRKREITNIYAYATRQ